MIFAIKVTLVFYCIAACVWAIRGLWDVLSEELDDYGDYYDDE